ncbi:hypothetical protein, partial [Mycolicibacterium sp. CBMA 360]|uniref:hypothetical protein n=1 Tax=Mycolicibacterium sp. CBMA 360 TaxID=2606614 RepID=UPI0013969C96
HPKTGQNSNQKNPITNKRHQKLASKNNNHTPQTGKHEAWSKKQQTKTTKHTIEFSNNTPFSGNPTSLLLSGQAVKHIRWAFFGPLALDLQYISGRTFNSPKPLNTGGFEAESQHTAAPLNGP